MATYVISDIHGNLDLFKELLKTVEFKYDGTDKLYLLGDYVDWGPKSLETLLYVKELSEKYDFIHPLIGNHDLMFWEQIQLLKKPKPEIYDNWVYHNGGKSTLESFIKLTQEEMKEIEIFIDNLPYRAEVIVNNKKYILAHACPMDEYEYDNDADAEYNRLCYEDYRENAVWNRITRKVPNVIRWFDHKGEYENAIIGHTITEYIENGHFSIINNPNNYINIDCGAKIIGHYEFFEAETLARLALLRLDDMEVFYTTLKDEETKEK